MNNYIVKRFCGRTAAFSRRNKRTQKLWICHANTRRFLRTSATNCRILILAALLLGSALPCAAQQEKPLRAFVLDEIVIEASRSLAAIGVQKTKIDSVALRQNVTNSLADVLSQNSSIFIKSYGRATLSTASVRGTAPSHTVVSWNGMNVNSPMLGMVDFSLIPSYFIDRADVYEGASSIGVAGGGLGGAVTLSTAPMPRDKGIGLRYIQGISSFHTYDQFLHLTYGCDKWQFSTRANYASSRNDFKYTNYYKWKYPVERNRNGAFNDLHVLQEIYYTDGPSRWGFAAWYMNSRRGIPLLNVDFHEENRTENRQSEETMRTTLSWDMTHKNTVLSAKAGYTYTDLKYRETSPFDTLTNSKNYVHTAFGRFEVQHHIQNKWVFAANLSASQHFVQNADSARVAELLKIDTILLKIDTIGYKAARFEVSAFASVRYRPTPRLGLAVNLRGDLYGHKVSPPIPAFFGEYIIDRKKTVVAKVSVARNYRYPTLNELYFSPGGNPALRPERGFTYDAGIEYDFKRRVCDLHTEITFFDSRINDWILWLYTGNRQILTPVNVKKVHSYGVEIKKRYVVRPGRGWLLSLQGNYAITKAINVGEPMNDADRSVGKQLMYVPVNSASVIGRFKWKKWEFIYKWLHYGERFATSSNDRSNIYRVSPYYMSDISLERRIGTKWADMAVKVMVNNIFDEEYESVLSRPMAGRNFGIFLDVKPRLRRR